MKQVSYGVKCNHEAAMTAYFYKPKPGKYRHRTAVRHIKAWRGKYKPRS